MKINFYFFNFQCPISNETINLLNNYEDDFQINYYDISDNPLVAKENNIYFPFLTVFNDKIRWRSPLNKRVIEKVKEVKEIVEQPYIIENGKEKFYGQILELTDETIHLLSRGCTMNDCDKSCLKKKQFLSKLCNGFYGYLHLDKGRVVGGVEYLPSLKVPYDIPKDPTTAFLTCIYYSSTKFDYKSYPLEKLEEKLTDEYKTIEVISDEFGSFPNGNLQWFLEHGYIDNGVISTEENYCNLHLMTKRLKK